MLPLIFAGLQAGLVGAIVGGSTGFWLGAAFFGLSVLEMALQPKPIPPTGQTLSPADSSIGFAPTPQYPTPETPVPVVFGKARLNGVVIYKKAYSEDFKRVHYVCVMGESGYELADDPNESNEKLVYVNKLLMHQLGNYYTKMDIGIDQPIFMGSGLDDISISGTYDGVVEKVFLIKINKIVDNDYYDTFSWSTDGGESWSEEAAITGSAQLLTNGVYIAFSSTTGHTSNDRWVLYCTPKEITNPTFSGSGLDDMIVSGIFLEETTITYVIQIDSEGTPDTFKWSKDGGATWEDTGIEITREEQNLEHDIYVKFLASTGHTLNENWTFRGIAQVKNRDSSWYTFYPNGGSIKIPTDNTGVYHVQAMTNATGELYSNIPVIFRGGGNITLTANIVWPSSGTTTQWYWKLIRTDGGSSVGNITFDGSGENDFSVISDGSGYTENAHFRIEIDSEGTPDTFRWAEYDKITPIFTSGTGTGEIYVEGTLGDSATEYIVEYLSASGEEISFKWTNDGGSNWTSRTVDVGKKINLENDIYIAFTTYTSYQYSGFVFSSVENEPDTKTPYGYVANDQWTFKTWDAVGVAITGSNQVLNANMTVKFDATTGHNLYDTWKFSVSPTTITSSTFGGWYQQTQTLDGGLFHNDYIYGVAGQTTHDYTINDLPEDSEWTLSMVVTSLTGTGASVGIFKFVLDDGTVFDTVSGKASLLHVHLLSEASVETNNPIVNAVMESAYVDALEGSNPATTLYTVLTDYIEGFNLSTDLIDSSSVATVEAWELSNGYLFNRAYTTLNNKEQVIKEILAAGRMMLRIDDGQIVFDVEKEEDSHYTIRKKHIKPGTLKTRINTITTPNRLEVQYVEPEYDYAVERLYVDNIDSINSYGLQPLTIDLAGVTNQEIAYKLGYMMLQKLVNCKYVASFQVGYNVRKDLVVGKVLEAYDSNNAIFDDHKWRIKTIEEIENFIYEVTCEQYLASVYSEPSYTPWYSESNEINQLFNSPLLEATASPVTELRIEQVILEPAPNKSCSVTINFDTPTERFDYCQIEMSYNESDWMKVGTAVGGPFTFTVPLKWCYLFIRVISFYENRDNYTTAPVISKYITGDERNTDVTDYPGYGLGAFGQQLYGH